MSAVQVAAQFSRENVSQFRNMKQLTIIKQEYLHTDDRLSNLLHRRRYTYETLSAQLLLYHTQVSRGQDP